MQILDIKEESEKEAKKDGENKDGQNKAEAETDAGGENQGEAKADTDQQPEELKKAKEYLEGGEEKQPETGKKRKRSESSDSSSDDDAAAPTAGDEELPPGMKKDNTEDQEDVEANKKVEEETKEEKKPEEPAEEEEGGEKMEEGDDKAKPFHKTSSIFLRNLAPTITKQEVEAMCKRYPGFLRCSIADPAPDRRWFRRGWVTFEREVKIKEICYSLNNIRLRDCEIGPIVNRDLTRRVRTVNGITVDRKVVRADIKLAAKVISNLDKRWGLWQQQSGGEKSENGVDKSAANDNKTDDAMLGTDSNNPVLHNITDYLIEEASAEEEELLGKNNDLEDGEEGEEGSNIVRDEELVKVLDRLVKKTKMVNVWANCY